MEEADRRVRASTCLPARSALGQTALPCLVFGPTLLAAAGFVGASNWRARTPHTDLSDLGGQVRRCGKIGPSSCTQLPEVLPSRPEPRPHAHATSLTGSAPEGTDVSWCRAEGVGRRGIQGQLEKETRAKRRENQDRDNKNKGNKVRDHHNTLRKKNLARDSKPHLTT